MTVDNNQISQHSCEFHL